MESAQIIFTQEIDATLLDHIGDLRKERLQAAKCMLQDLDRTAHDLTQKGLLEKVDRNELRAHLEGKIAILHTRIQETHTIYEDELTLYADLLSD